MSGFVKGVLLVTVVLAGLLARGEFGDVHGLLAPELRTTYVSLGKLVEDRPMQATAAKGNIDLDFLGRFGVTFWGLSSLSDRKHDVHRHVLYFNDIGPYWNYDWEIAEGWKLKSEVSRQWSLFRGFRPTYANSEHTIHWYQVDQELANPYLTPFWRIRPVFRPADLLYFKIGVKRRFPLWDDFYVQPAVQVDGGDSVNNERRYGKRANRRRQPHRAGSMIFRLEFGWKVSPSLTAFATVEEYLVVSSAARGSVAASSDPCAAKDLTLGTVGVRWVF